MAGPAQAVPHRGLEAGEPGLGHAGHLGKDRRWAAVSTVSTRSTAAHMRLHLQRITATACTWPPMTSVMAWLPPLVGHMRELDAGGAPNSSMARCGVELLPGEP